MNHKYVNIFTLYPVFWYSILKTSLPLTASGRTCALNKSGRYSIRFTYHGCPKEEDEKKSQAVRAQINVNDSI